MRALPLLLLLSLLPLPALAIDTALTGADFDTYTRGKTLTFTQNGQIYGAEQYLPDHRVLWAFQGESCQKGTWYEVGNHICFEYEHQTTAQCWSFWREGGRLKGRFVGDTPGQELQEVAQSPDPLACSGPDLGV